MNPTPATRQSSSLRRYLRSPWLRPFNDAAAWEDLLRPIAPRGSFTQIRARVIDVIVETPDTRTFVLRPNGRWQGFRAGQHVVIEVEIDGARHHRSFSLSSAPARGAPISLTIKRQAGSKVSAWLHDHLKPGATLKLSAAAGEFGLGDSEPAQLLLLSAGSGITPVMSVLRDLHQRGFRGDVAFVHSCRTPADTIFGDELRRLAQDWPQLRLHLHFSAVDGRIDRSALARLVPDYSQRTSLVCGPQAFTDWVGAAYRDAEAEGRLQSESFHGRVFPVQQGSAALSVRVYCTKTEQSFTAAGEQALLVEAEGAGLTPKHGCRIGICRTCQCTKRSGTVENLLTGLVSSEPDQIIQLCISAARSDLELAL